MRIILGIIFSFVFLTPIFAEEVTDMYEEGAEEKETPVVTETEDTGSEEEEVLDITKEDTSEDFYNIQLIVGSQSGFDKYVPIIVRITPNKTPTKTQITWEVPDDFNIRIKHREFIESLAKDETYEYKIRVKPETSGTYEIFVNVTAWEPESNYTTSTSTIISFNENLVVDGSDSNYIITTVVKILLIILFIAGIGFGIYKGWNKLLTFLKEYLKPPEV